MTNTTHGLTTATTFGVHTRTRYGVYTFVGAFATRKEAQRALARETMKGTMATAWIRFEDGEKVCEWDHEHDTMQDALVWATAF